MPLTTNNYQLDTLKEAALQLLSCPLNQFIVYHLTGKPLQRCELMAIFKRNWMNLHNSNHQIIFGNEYLTNFLELSFGMLTGPPTMELKVTLLISFNLVIS